MLFNDRYGRERVFVHVSNGRIFFSSEAKAILAVAPATRKFDIVGLAELLTCGCTLGSRSPFAGIEVLDPGTVMMVEEGRVHRRRYFGANTLEQQPPASEREFLDGFPDALRRAVNAYAGDSKRVAVSLTGGLDSRMVMASLDAPATVSSYTFGSMYRVTGDAPSRRRLLVNVVSHIT